MSEESTTPDLVGVMQGMAKAASERDFATSDSSYAVNAVWDSSRTGVGIYEGMPAIRRLFDDWRSGFEEWEISFEELLDLGNGVVFTLVRQAGRPVGATGSVRQREAWIWMWIEGLIAHVTTYPDTDIDEARAVAERLAEERG
jgi:ketosteroid isomerase-like protein